MTVIAASKTSSAIIFAADTQVTDRLYSKTTSSDIIHSKLFQQNGMIIGSTGDCYEGTLMELFSRNHQPIDTDRLSVY